MARRCISRKRNILLFFVPLVDETGHLTAEFAEFVDVVDHLGSGESGDGIILAEVDCLLRTDLLTEAAVDTTDHVDIESLRALLDLAPPLIFRDFLGLDGDGARRTNKFTELAAHAFIAPKLVAHEGRSAAIPIGHLGVPLLLGVLHGDFRLPCEEAEHVFERDKKTCDNRRQVDFFSQCEVRACDGVSHMEDLVLTMFAAQGNFGLTFFRKSRPNEDSRHQLNQGEAALEGEIGLGTKNLGFFVMPLGELKRGGLGIGIHDGEVEVGVRVIGI